MTASRALAGLDDPSATRVHVYKDRRHVGVLTAEGVGSLRFAYAPEVLDDPTAAVSVLLPVQATPYRDLDVLACFENLLPEGDLRSDLARAVHVDPGDVVGLLGVFAGECAGALSLWPEGTTPPDPPRYAPYASAGAPPLPWGAHANAEEGTALGLTLREARLSLSGAQDKLVLFRRPPTGPGTPPEPPEYRLPIAGAPSTVLVKRASHRFPGLLHNELLGMRLMAAAGVPTADTTVHGPDPSLFETARFDRVLDGTRVTRLHAEDGCQLTGRRSRQKYASTGGPSYHDLVTQLARHSEDFPTDVERLFRWAVANLALGNRDAHAKNVSVLHTTGGRVRLAPVYDVCCTLVYPLATDLPLNFGGGRHPAALSPHALRVAAREFRLGPSRVAALTAAVCEALDAGLTDALHEVARLAGPHEILDRLQAVVREEVAQTRARLLGG